MQKIPLQDRIREQRAITSVLVLDEVLKVIQNKTGSKEIAAAKQQGSQIFPTFASAMSRQNIFQTLLPISRQGLSRAMLSM